MIASPNRYLGRGTAWRSRRTVTADIQRGSNPLRPVPLDASVSEGNWNTRLHSIILARWSEWLRQRSHKASYTGSNPVRATNRVILF